MNNQAAQTMPEPVTASMCPSSDYAKGWNDCLAAMLAAAPAASGAHPDALPDGTLSKSTAKRLAAASVSERARELADEWRHVLDDGEDGHELCASRNTVARFVNVIDALEQALTQQRGTGQWEVIVTGWTKADGKTLWLEQDGTPMFRIGEHGDIGTNRAVHLTTHPYRHTTPQPSADAVREDSARLDWIESQIREYGDGYTEPREAGWGIQWQQERPDHYWPGLRAWIDEERRRASGDELESLLSAASDHQQNAAQGGGVDRG